ncbi:helix-turn-helix domain-containing protein [Microbacterium trichothecenolyticum]|uniref:IclR family transcriptional regulator n=1 Tax=Microbacterium trichothecenolyticum TaxID=69370 RepID=UPI001C6E1AFF|nr:helix-turn-helix domain-containing protein [Microbacterium trichothecenolyticum]MBW9122321.1 helix-turn-helix domain-containing protein [Microbacterium trichothecenolyticum]
MVTQSVLRSLEVFEQVAAMQPARLAELAGASDLPKSTIQRNLLTLAEAGWLRPADDESTARWQVSPRLQQLLASSAIAPDLRGAATPVMEELSGHTGLSVQLAVPSTRRQIVSIATITVPGGAQVSTIGSALPMIETSAGIAMLARSADFVIAEIVEASNGDLAETMGAITAAREQGYSLRPHDAGAVTYLSAAIVDPTGGTAGALTLGVRPADGEPAAYGTGLVEAASRVSSVLVRLQGG